MKIIFIIIDGLGDEPIPALKNRTPLEAARTPNLDSLARNGICGLVFPWTKKEKLPTSEDTHLALFGFNPGVYNPGRGVLEVMGIGMKVLPGDVCLRGNFATLDSKGKIIDRRAGRIDKTRPLIKALNGMIIEGVYPVKSRKAGAVKPPFNRVKFLIGKAVSHRIGIIIRGKNLSARISDNDLKVAGTRPLSIKALDRSGKAKYTAGVLNQFLEKAHCILKNHSLNEKRKLPANYILVRGAGAFKKSPTFYEKHKLKAGCIAAGTVYKGVGKYLNMKMIGVKGATGLPDTNLEGKFSAAKKALNRLNFIFCHIKAADDLAHDGNFQGKKDFIEKIDKKISALLNLKRTLLVVTGDHSTCSLKKRHCSKPLPVLIYCDRMKPDNVKYFSEKSCKEGGLGKIKQLNLIQKVISYNK